MEPTLQLESHGGDRTVIEVGVGGRPALVVQVFLDHVVHFIVVASRDAAQDDLRHLVSAHHGIRMVGDIGVVTVAARVVVHGERNYALGGVGVVVAQNENCRRGHVPSVVGGADEVADGCARVATALRHGKDLSGDALLGPELLDAVGQRDEVFVVGGDDDVFTTRLAIFVMFAQAFSIVHFGQVVAVEDDVLQNLVPFRGAVAKVAIAAVAAFHVKLQFHVAIDDKLLGDGVILEWHHAHKHYLHASDFGDFRNLKWRLGIKGIAPINAGVFLIEGRGVVVFELRHCCRDEIDVFDDLGRGRNHP